MVDVLSVKTTLSISLRSPGLKTHFAINYGQVNSYYDLNCSSAMATPASMGHSNDLYGLKRYFVRLCHLTLCAILCQFLYSYKLSLMFSTSKNSLGVKVVANSHSSPWNFFQPFAFFQSILSCPDKQVCSQIDIDIEKKSSIYFPIYKGDNL